jgi:signal transduction histidine kinase/CheY-like chemotaxis protein
MRCDDVCVEIFQRLSCLADILQVNECYILTATSDGSELSNLSIALTVAKAGSESMFIPNHLELCSNSSCAFCELVKLSLQSQSPTVVNNRQRMHAISAKLHNFLAYPIKLGNFLGLLVFLNSPFGFLECDIVIVAKKSRAINVALQAFSLSAPSEFVCFSLDSNLKLVYYNENYGIFLKDGISADADISAVCRKALETGSSQTASIHLGETSEVNTYSVIACKGRSTLFCFTSIVAEPESSEKTEGKLVELMRYFRLPSQSFMPEWLLCTADTRITHVSDIGYMVLRRRNKEILGAQLAAFFDETSCARMLVANSGDAVKRIVPIGTQYVVDAFKFVENETVYYLFVDNLLVEKDTSALETSEEEHSAVLSSAAHEIRNPLSAIIGGLYLLRDVNDTSPGKEICSSSILAAEYLSDIVNNILDERKLSAGKMALALTQTSFARIFYKIEQILSTYPYADSTSFHIFRTGDGFDHFMADETRFCQVLVNLLSNAFKFTETGFCVIQLHTIVVDAAVEWRLRVVDSGRGIEEEHASRLFTAFAQFDARSSAEGPSGRVRHSSAGSGLGLFISSQLLRLMQATISWKRNDQPCGSIFEISGRFPIDCHPEGSPSCHADNPPTPTRHVHVLARVQLVRETLAAVLQSKGYLVNTWASTKEMVEDIDWTRADVVAYVDCWENSGQFSLVHRERDMKGLATLKAGACRDRCPTFWLLTSKVRLQSADANTFDVIFSRPYFETHAKDSASGGNIQAMEEHTFPDTNPQPIESKITAFNDPKPVNSLTSSEEEVSLKSSASAEKTGPQKLVLLAEDNGINRKLLRYTFSELGIPCHITSNGASCLAYYKANHTDVTTILLDCKMPVMDGFECSRNARNFEQQHNLTPAYICALTGSRWVEIEQQCKSSGMNACLTKPVRKHDLQKLFNTIKSTSASL